MTVTTSISYSLTLLALAGTVRAISSSDPPPPAAADITSFAFQQPLQHEVEFYTSDADESSFDESESSIVSSSLLYDGGCLVSAEAIMCVGGDEYSLSDCYMNEDDDDDEDEDDDDDGHSSMLSNASLRRSAFRSSLDDSSRNSSRQQRQSARPSEKLKTKVPSSAFRKRSFMPTTANKALALRGGAAAPGLGSEFAEKLIVTALVTLLYEGSVGHIMEFVKIAMQTSPPGTTYGEVIKSITAEKGVGGLWDGFCPWGIIQAIFKGAVFGLAHAVAISVFVPLAEKGTIPMPLAQTLSGGIGGGFQGFVLSPTLLLKTRVMTNAVFRESMSLWETTVKSATIGFDVVKSEGVGALMKGANVFATKRVFDWASRYYFSDLFESLAVDFKGEPLALSERMWCSLLGGTASTVVTLPLDVLVAKIQDSKKAGVKTSPIQMFLDELDEKGWNGLRNSYTQGFIARLLHVATTTVVIKTCNPIAYEAIFGSKK